MKKEKAKRGDGVFYRDGALYISWTLASGKRMKRRAHGETLAEAREDRNEEIRKENMIRRFKMAPPTDKTFAVVAKEHLSERKSDISPDSYQREADIIRLHLEPFFQLLLADIRPSDIQRYVTTRKADSVAAATVCKELNIIKAIFGYARRLDYLPSNPAAEVRGPKVRVKEQPYLQVEEFAALISFCPVWMRPIVCFGLATGIRLGNIITLEWGNVDLKKGKLKLPKTKNGEVLNLPLNEMAMRVLLVLAAAGEVRKRQRVFGYEGKHNRISVEFKRAATKANLPLHFHNLRHSFCAHSIMAGNDGITVQKLLGHKTASMTSRYAHLSPAFLAGATAKLDTAFAALLPPADGTQMSTSEKETVSTPDHSCPSDENIQPQPNTAVKELSA
jgi:integrase